VNQAFQPMGRQIQGSVIYRVLILLPLGRLNTDLYFSLGCGRAMLVKQ
jgi:hypothetical protein